MADQIGTLLGRLGDSGEEVPIVSRGSVRARWRRGHESSWNFWVDRLSIALSIGRSRRARTKTSSTWALGRLGVTGQVRDIMSLIPHRDDPTDFRETVKHKCTKTGPLGRFRWRSDHAPTARGEELKRRALGRLLRSESARIVRKFRKDPRSETYAMTCIYVSLRAICGNRRLSTPILSVPLRKGGGRFVGVSCRGCPESTAWIAGDGRG